MAEAVASESVDSAVVETCHFPGLPTGSCYRMVEG
jgi:hypothetical protein